MRGRLPGGRPATAWNPGGGAPAYQKLPPFCYKSCIHPVKKSAAGERGETRRRKSGQKAKKKEPPRKCGQRTGIAPRVRTFAISAA